MIEFLVNDSNYWFSLALAIMLGLLLLELLTMLLGASLSGMVDSAMPDVDLNTSPSVDTVSLINKVLGWFYVDKTPSLITLIIFLSTFGLLGLLTQTITINIFQALIPTWIVAPTILLLSLPITKVLRRLFSLLIPTEETSAVSTDSFVGNLAIISQGTARVGLAAEAKLKDEHGQTHYVRVEPEKIQDEFPKGTEVIIFDKKPNSNVFLANRFTN